MGSEDADLLDDRGNGRLSLGLSSVSCSICLEVVTDNGDRSRAKLQCGHEFHLDCIGSAFNAKGVMQCPNCRKIEKGQWLYASGVRSFPEFSMEEWTHDEDPYDISYSELPFGVHWCPFSGLTRVPPSFEESETPSTAYHEFLGHHAIFTEHTAASSAAHSCPYFAYFQPLQPSSSNSNEAITDGPNFNHHWNALSGPGDISTAHGFSAMDLHYHHSPPFSPTSSHIGGADQASVPSTTLRSSRGDPDGISRSGSFLHPFLLGHGSGHRAGTSVISSNVPPFPGSSARAHERIQGLQAYHQQQQPNNSAGLRSPVFSGTNRRSSGQRGLAPVRPVSSSDHASGFYIYPPSGSSTRNIQETENPFRNHFYAWERDRFAPFPLIPVERESSWWGPFHQGSGGSDSGSRSNSFWYRHGSERVSLSRSENTSHQPGHPSGRLHPFI